MNPTSYELINQRLQPCSRPSNESLQTEDDLILLIRSDDSDDRAIQMHKRECMQNEAQIVGKLGDVRRRIEIAVSHRLFEGLQ